MNDSLLLIRRKIAMLREKMTWELLHLILTSKESARTKKKLIRVIPFAPTYKSFIPEYLKTSVSLVKERTSSPGSAPTVICVVKDDFRRMRLFLDYYRKIGVRAFSVLDDHSSDGTREFLMQQDDVSLYQAEDSYTSLRRCIWINRIVEREGINRWYLIVDSDELFDYNQREQHPLPDLVKHLEKKKKTGVKAVMVDLFSRNGFFDEEGSEDLDIEKDYCLFSPGFWLEFRPKCGYRVKGGARAALMRMVDPECDVPVETKYPLIFFDKKELVINAHFRFPFKRNQPKDHETILRHYKFLPEDKEKYMDRIQKGAMWNNSIEYRSYFQVMEHADYQSFIKDLTVLDKENFCGQISIMTPIDWK